MSSDGAIPQLDGVIVDQQIFLLNMIEEFSLRVEHLNTQQHPALSSVQAPFVDMVEKNAVALIFIRDVLMDNPKCKWGQPPFIHVFKSNSVVLIIFLIL